MLFPQSGPVSDRKPIIKKMTNNCTLVSNENKMRKASILLA